MTRKFPDMSENKIYNQIKEAAQLEKVAPPQSAWLKVQKKINEENNRPSFFRISSRVLLSIAASIVLVALCFSVLDLNIVRKSDLTKGKIAEWENLDMTLNNFYSVQDARALNKIFEYENEAMVN